MQMLLLKYRQTLTQPLPPRAPAIPSARTTRRTSTSVRVSSGAAWWPEAPSRGRRSPPGSAGWGALRGAVVDAGATYISSPSHCSHFFSSPCEGMFNSFSHPPTGAGSSEEEPGCPSAPARATSATSYSPLPQPPLCLLCSSSYSLLCFCDTKNQYILLLLKIFFVYPIFEPIFTKDRWLQCLIK